MVILIFKLDMKISNLDRARNQIKLVQDIEDHFKKIKKYIIDSYNSFNK